MPQVIGLETLLRKMKRLAKENPIRARNVIKKQGNIIKRESLKIVPTDTGELAESAFVRVVEDSEFMWILEVGFSVDYAEFVHDNLEAAHGVEFNTLHAYEISTGREHPRRPQEQAQFLSSVVRGNIDRIRSGIKQELMK